MDLKAVPPTVATINRLAKSAVFVLTQTPPRGGRIREAEAGLSMLGIVCPVRIVARAAYQDAHGSRARRHGIRAERQGRHRNPATLELDRKENGENSP